MQQLQVNIGGNTYIATAKEICQFPLLSFPILLKHKDKTIKIIYQPKLTLNEDGNNLTLTLLPDDEKYPTSTKQISAEQFVKWYIAQTDQNQWIQYHPEFQNVISEAMHLLRLAFIKSGEYPYQISAQDTRKDNSGLGIVTNQGNKLVFSQIEFTPRPGEIHLKNISGNTSLIEKLSSIENKGLYLDVYFENTKFTFEIEHILSTSFQTNSCLISVNFINTTPFELDLATIQNWKEYTQQEYEKYEQERYRNAVDILHTFNTLNDLF